MKNSLTIITLLVCLNINWTTAVFAEGGAMKITSPAFQNEGMIPSKYTCDGQDVSPALEWTGVPENTTGLVLIADDPDAPMGTWVHWVLFNIPPTVTGLPEGAGAETIFSDGTQSGTSSFKRLGYGGPCPPSGTHRYYFKVYALDAKLDLASGASKQDVVRAMKGHVLAQGELMGRYKRQ
jgi:Raf kinase inhibitor-like YbhB/YbcL family protein